MSCPPTPTASSNPSSQNTSSGLLLTPQDTRRLDGTVVFLREEGQTDFVPLHHPSSVTLQELVDEFNISSVVECDARGIVPARAVAFDSPSDVLHSGRHYVVRRDARAEDRGSRVTFRGKIQVKEYELEHATPPAHRSQQQQPVAFFSAIGTPLPLGHRLDDENALSHTLVSGQKRAREEATEEGEASAVAVEAQDALSASTETASTTLSARTAVPLTTNEEAEPVAPRSLFFSDRTNTIATTGATVKAETATSAPWSSSASSAGASLGGPDAYNNHNKENGASAEAGCGGAGVPLRFIPFPIEVDGTETLITLEDLKALCVTDDTAQQQQSHEEALSILEGARRVLFKSP